MRHEVAQEMRVGPSESAGAEISRTNLFLEITMGMEKPMSQYIVAVMEAGISFPPQGGNLSARDGAVTVAINLSLGIMMGLL